MEEAKGIEQPAVASVENPAVTAAVPSTMQIAPTVAVPPSLHAKVNAKAIVDGTGRLYIQLEISAENRSTSDLQLNVPYTLAVTNGEKIATTAEILQTSTGNNQGSAKKSKTSVDVRGHAESEAIIVDFIKTPTLKPGEILHMTVSFEAEGAFEVEHEVLWGPYVITPMSKYQDLPVSHNFDYEFVFKKPKAEKWEEKLKWPFKVNEVHQSNKRGKVKGSIAAKPKRGLRRTVIRFANVDIPAGEKLRIMFVREYKYWNWMIAVVGAAVTFIADIVFHDTVQGWAEAFKQHVLPHLKFWT